MSSPLTHRPWLSQLRSGVERLLETLTLSLIVALALVVVVGITFRKAGAPLVWYDEVASILLAWVTYYGAALAALHRAHIGFPKLARSLNPLPRLAVLALREIIVIGFFAVTAWAGWQVLLVLDDMYLVSLPWVSASLAQSVMPIGAVLFIVAELMSIPDELADIAQASLWEAQE